MPNQCTGTAVKCTQSTIHTLQNGNGIVRASNIVSYGLNPTMNLTLPTYSVFLGIAKITTTAGQKKTLLDLPNTILVIQKLNVQNFMDSSYANASADGQDMFSKINSLLSTPTFLDCSMFQDSAGIGQPTSMSRNLGIGANLVTAAANYVVMILDYSWLLSQNSNNGIDVPFTLS